MPAWIDLNHTPLEWALFGAAFAGLVLLKIYVRKRRSDLE